MEAKVIVTTVKDKPLIVGKAKVLSQELGCSFVERKEHSFAALQKLYGSNLLIVVGEKHISARVGEDEFFFHPSMALLRLMNFLKGEPDRMAQAMDLQPGISVLDCTLGFGTDALVTSFLIGPGGTVTGLEASSVVAALVKHGMQEFRPKIHNGLDEHKALVLKGLPEAISRIKVINMRHSNYLQSLPDRSVDVVYFDPMFRKPCEDSSSISPLRNLAVPDRVEIESVQEACRVARKRVVLKEGRYSNEFTRLGFQVEPGGKYSQVAFGVIKIGG